LASENYRRKWVGATNGTKNPMYRDLDPGARESIFSLLENLASVALLASDGINIFNTIESTVCLQEETHEFGRSLLASDVPCMLLEAF